MKISLQINQKELERELTKEIQRKVNQAIPRIQSALNERFENMLLQRFNSGVPPFSPREIAEIGVPDLNLRIQSIIREAAKSFEIKVVPANLLRINISILRKNHEDLLSLPESVFQYVSSRGSGILEWLRWLLLEGNNTIVNEFDYRPSNSPASRAGGLMVKGTGWNMPETISGIEGNNILTRCLDNIGKDIEMIVRAELNRLIR